jgi:hypothetical protein|tara:strand:- start:12376 stop:12642 length:267 start_codon:yes stop_codon:yes gene_type:complete
MAKKKIQKNSQKESTLGIISTICGVIGIFMAGFLLGLIGLILGILAWKKNEVKVLYIIGITTSVIAFISSVLFWGSVGFGILSLFAIN